MRQWHYKLIPYLDDKRLVKQHAETCAFRGKLLGRGNYPGASKDTGIDEMIFYHQLVLDEMDKRGFKYDDKWRTPCSTDIIRCHTNEYLTSCIDTLRSRGIEIHDHIVRGE